MTVKTIWHVGGWSSNYGDRALQIATTKIMRDRAPAGTELRFVYVDNQNTYFSPQMIAKLNAEADMLLLGGGGFIFHRPQDNSHSGWQFNIDTENISSIEVPIAVYGIGYNKFPYDSGGFPDYMWDSVKEVVNRSIAFSVRNMGTYETMEAEGVDMTNVTVVPDAAVFAEAYPYTHSCLENNKLKIGFNWATDRWNQRFDLSSNTSLAQVKLDTTLNVLKEKAQEHNAYVYMIEHLMPNELNKLDKEDMRDMFMSKMGSDGYVVSECMAEELYPPYDYKAGMFVDIYRQMDLVVGMRGHANIIAFGQNTPPIGIGEHNKVKWFLDDVELSNLVVRLDKDTEGDIADLRIAIDDVVNNLATYKANMDAKKTQLDIIKNTFVDQVIAGL